MDEGPAARSCYRSISRIVSSTFWLSAAGPDQQHCLDSDSVQCLKLLRELNGQVSAYHQLAIGLGTASGDGQSLRGRLKRTRRRARQLASIVRCLILSLDGNESSGRLWCLLYCCLYILALEMQRTLQLQRTFALHPAAGFINTGLVQQQLQQQQQQQNRNHAHHGHHHESNSLVDDEDDIPLADRLSLERAEINQLQQEIEELEYALQELRSNHHVVEIESYLTMTDPSSAGLDLCCTSSAGPHDRSMTNINQRSCCSNNGDYRHGTSEELDDDSIGSCSSDDNSGSMVKQRRCLCVVMGIVIIVFVLATVLGASLAFQHQD